MLWARLAPAYVFTHRLRAWHQVATLVSGDPSDDNSFGFPVAISPGVAVVGDPGFKGSTGSAYVSSRTPSTRRQSAEGVWDLPPVW